ncbi:hypothetical protein SAMN05216299_11541 [Nitrosospira sp. Nsp14]|nr:hypothetical protein SAMN05216299_11541 [Nitrosospira sp. Nsp14]
MYLHLLTQGKLKTGIINAAKNLLEFSGIY